MSRRKHRPEEPLFPAGSRENGPRPLVAVVGRPNVGKSTLFNRLVGRRLAIVHDEPGVTRDRHYADAWFGGRGYTLVDTGGFDPESDDPMRKGIARQVELAVGEADVIVCVFDASTGLTDADRVAVSLLRKSNKPVLYAVNKADSPRAEAEAAELYRLGVDRLYGVSALHGRGVGELEADLINALPPEEPAEPEPAEGEGPARPLRIAVVGRPNAGKSSLINRLAGDERVLVDARPGTTRDSIDTLIEHNGKRYVLVDTAGIRRKAKVAREESFVEAQSVLHAVRALERCDVAVLLSDASEGVSEQDAKIVGLAADRGRALVVGLNKADLLTAGGSSFKQAEQDAREKLSFVPYAPICALSALTGRGVGNLLTTIDRVAENFARRVETGKLNRFFEQVLQTHPPPTQGGKAPRLYYVTQASTRPPLFVAMSNAPESIHFSYQRYVINQLRKAFDFEGAPIHVKYKARRKHIWDRPGGSGSGSGSGSGA
ncbi:MAG: ribosome biogenesis GTPase Der [Polyangiaceae bacterium]|jgi:GTP-binding protein|nr:ribosome biogenesis GTPase Der [Polyangiaceae bacterium]